jgi:rhomboid family GlyGly-CTERM serine protease
MRAAGPPQSIRRVLVRDGALVSGIIEGMRVAVAPAEWFALAGAALVLLLQLTDAGPTLEYRRALLPAEPWRLLTGHLVHVNWRHAALNALAWVALARLFAPELAPTRQAWLLACSAVGTGLLLWWAAPDVAWYRGLSGALHGLFAAAAVLWLARASAAIDRPARSRLWPALLLVAVWGKALAEYLLPGADPNGTWLGVRVITGSHLAGAAIGTLAGLLTAALRPATIPT